MELRDFIEHQPPTPDSALYRDLHPKSWWWTTEHDFYASILYSLQVSNWQRGGGKGSKPKPVKRPVDKPVRRQHVDPASVDELAARKRRMKSEIERRRQVASGD